jgi:hypothetical protein
MPSIDLEGTIPADAAGPLHAIAKTFAVLQVSSNSPHKIQVPERWEAAR